MHERLHACRAGGFQVDEGPYAVRPLAAGREPVRALRCTYQSSFISWRQQQSPPYCRKSIT